MGRAIRYSLHPVVRVLLSRAWAPTVASAVQAKHRPTVRKAAAAVTHAGAVGRFCGKLFAE